MPAPRLPAPRRPMTLERLEDRALLTADTGLEPDATPGIAVGWEPESDPGSDVWHTLGTPVGPWFSAGFSEAAAATPWIAAAEEGATGAVVFWIKLSVDDGTSTLQAVPIWARLNPPANQPTVSGLAVDGEAADPVDEAALMDSLDGLLFHGPGGADEPPAPPLTFAELADFTPEPVAGVQEYFLVVRSSFDFALASVTTGILLAGAPAGATGADGEGTITITDGAGSAPDAAATPAASDPPPPADDPLPAPLAWLLRLRSQEPLATAGDPATAFPAGGDAPRWLVDAQQGDSGVLVMWVTETVAAGTSSIAMLPVWVRWNPADAGDPGWGAFMDDATSTSSTVVYPGDGPDADAGSWPRPVESFDTLSTPRPDGTRSYFVVLRSRSNMEIQMASVFAVLAQAPAGAFAGVTTAGDGEPVPLAGLAGGDAGAFTAFLRGFGQDSVAAPEVRLAHDTGTSGTDRITNRGRLEVDTAPGFRARYSTDDGLTWRKSFRPRDGVNAVLVRQVNRDGLASPATPFAFTLDRRRPAAPRVVVAPADAAGAFVSAAQGSLVGTRLEPGARVEYSVNKRAWTAEPGLSLGLNSIRVRQVDVAGNVSQPSAPVGVWRLFAAPETSAAAAPVISLRPRVRR